MKRSIDEHAARFDELASEYDDNNTPEYKETVQTIVKYANPAPDETVLDLGCGTGAIALAVADTAEKVIGRDISHGMLEEAKKRAESMGYSNVSFGEGRFRSPEYDGPVDLVVSNFAMHHLADTEKAEAISVIAEYTPRRFVLGDLMFFGEPDPDAPFYDPEVDDPATVGMLVDELTSAGFIITDVEQIHPQVGVLVADLP